jgi:hypothetical protein
MRGDDIWQSHRLLSDRPMSALGQKQTFRIARAMSGLPLKADMCGATRDVRFGPKADIVPSVDQFVGTGKQ